MRCRRLALLAALTVAVAPAAAAAAQAPLDYPPGDYYVTEPPDCFAGSCQIPVRYESAPDEQVRVVDVDWLAPSADDAAFAADGRLACGPDVNEVGDAITACTGTSPVYPKAAEGFLAIRVTDRDGTQYAAVEPVLIDEATDSGSGSGSGTPPSGNPPGHPAADPCAPRAPHVACRPGRGRRPSGRGMRAWPAVTGIVWMVLDGTGRSKAGTAGNDELLGHRGPDRLSGGAGDDVLFGDWDPKSAATAQVDVLDGGAGADRISTSRGRNTVRGGAGADRILATRGRGTIDCGPGRDSVRMGTGAHYTTRNCERIRRG